MARPAADLVVVAASGLAREVLAALRDHPRGGSTVVLDDDPSLWGATVGGAPVVGGLQDVKLHETAEVLVCAGSGAARRRIVDRLDGMGVGAERFPAFVHPQAVVSSGCTVGPGSIVLAGVVLTADVRVGRHVVLMPHVTLTHDDEVGDYATLAAGVRLGGGVRVGPAAYLGMNASARQGLAVGSDATLGMGSVLLQDLPAGEVWAGVPARRLSRRSSGET